MEVEPKTIWMNDPMLGWWDRFNHVAVVESDVEEKEAKAVGGTNDLDERVRGWK